MYTTEKYNAYTYFLIKFIFTPENSQLTYNTCEYLNLSLQSLVAKQPDCERVKRYNFFSDTPVS